MEDFSSADAGVGLSLAVALHRIGPYHDARLRALAKVCSLTAVEYSKLDRTYEWKSVAKSDAYKAVTLFCDREIEGVSLAELQARVDFVMNRVDAKVVAIPGWSASASLAMLAWCKETGTPAVLMSDSTILDERRVWPKEFAKKVVVKHYSAAFVAGAAQRDYCQMLGIDLTKTFDGYDVVDNEYFHKRAEAVRNDRVLNRRSLGLPENYFLAVGRFVEKKNLIGLLDAYSRYRALVGGDAWSLVLVGDGPLKPQLLRRIDLHRIGDDVFLCGFKQYDEIPYYYALAGAFVLASSSEQWGLVVNEAMASGLPVIVSERAGCSRDLVQHGTNGYVFDPFDLDALTRHLLSIGNGECDRSGMSRASREIISQWSLDRYCSGMLKAAQAALHAPAKRFGYAESTLLDFLMRR